MEGAAAAILLPLLFTLRYASERDMHSYYRSCTESCEKTGIFMDKSPVPTCKDFQASCGSPGGLAPAWVWVSVLFESEWDCHSECDYLCMKDTELKRLELLEAPIKYHGKGPFVRYQNLKEPAALLFSVLNLLAHVHGLLSFYRLVFHKLPRRKGRSEAPYEYDRQWVIYGLFTINASIASALVHVRNVTITRQYDYSSGVALLGCSVIVALIRVANLRHYAEQQVVTFAIVPFTATHITVLGSYKVDYFRNMSFCVKLEVALLLLWAGWAELTNHRSRGKVWFVFLGRVVSMSLEILDFPPFWGVLDVHALWHLSTIPTTMLWWSFVKEDASGKVSRRKRRGAGPGGGP